MASRYEIIKPIEDSLKEFNLQYEGLANSGIKLLDTMVSHIGQTRGKQLRPILLLLISGAFENTSNKAVRAALAIETLHITTLIHDDVVDE
ncbi:MAG: polyprenyl synthetase family protein, partial [Bacteroidales bacterium]|nr:polyprenyl synthetase family protein [Bacteroidales bacterium]